MRVRHHWAGPLHLGSTLASKTLVPAQFGDTRSEPDQIVLVLKAWMLYRWQGNGGRFLERRSRKEAWERECDVLAIDIRNEGARQPCTPTRVPTFMSGHLRCCSARPLQRPWRWPLPVEGAAGCGMEEGCTADAGQWTGCRKRMRDAGCGLRDADAGCRMQDADAGCGVPMRNAGCGMRMAMRMRMRLRSDSRHYKTLEDTNPTLKDTSPTLKRH